MPVDDLQSILDMIQKLSDKIDKREENFVRVTEYNSRQIALNERVTAIELSVTRMGQYGLDEHKNINNNIEKKFDALATKIDHLENNIQLMKDGSSTAKTDVLKILGTSFLSFILGGGMIEVVKILITNHP